MSNLKSWLNHIESFHPDEIELGLDRISNLARKLNLLDLDCKVIMVGGTNGKGSCVATLESFALSSNLSVGCYTSPHLINFNERIRVNGEDISDNELISSFEKIEKAREQLALTFFEFTTLVALQIFKLAKLDLVILEVGLGGRLDAVNIIEPDVSIITTIDFDHQSWLGNSLPEIAFEKSGICRKGIVNLVGDRPSYNLIVEARPEVGSELTLIDILDKNDGLWSKFSELISDPSVNPHRLLLQNIMLATRAFEALFPLQFEQVDLRSVLTQINIKGRFQKISDDPLVIIDVGHNLQAARNLKQQIKSLKCKGKRYAICGMMADKAIGRFLKTLDDVIDTWYFVSLPVERAAKAEQLQTLYKKVFPNKQTYAIADTRKAYQDIIAGLSDEDQIFVFGSFVTLEQMIRCIEIKTNTMNEVESSKNAV